jgi:hypothetical protein
VVVASAVEGVAEGEAPSGTDGVETLMGWGTVGRLGLENPDSA